MNLPHVLRDYALVADGERGAVVGPRGDIVWLCFPRWDSEPVLASLLGGPGEYTVRPSDTHYVWGGQYDDDTLLWRSRWMVGGSIVECVEAMDFPGDSERMVLVRQVRAVEGPASVDVSLALRAPNGELAGIRPRRHGTTWELETGGTSMRWTVPDAAHWSRGVLTLHLDLEPGTHANLVLELSTKPFTTAPPDCDQTIAETTERWRSAARRLQGCRAERDARAALTLLRGLTASTGAMVAAATTSLPERADEGRNYDYRYAWIRDQCYAGLAGARAGEAGYAVLDDAVRFVCERVLDDGPALRPAYRVSGEPVPQERDAELPGYPGAPHVVFGNRAGSQFQLDVFGEALRLCAAAAAADRADATLWRAVDVAVDAIKSRSSEPDAGVWELTPAYFTSSRLACVSGLRAVAAQTPPGPTANRWLALADAITADVASWGVHHSGRWRRARDDDRVDASLLLGALRGAVPFNDPRSVGLLHAVSHDLVSDGYVYRYLVDGAPLGEREGAFLICGFWLALALHQQGHDDAAVALFERNRAACGPAGIFTEEYDVHERQLRGNFPQAFVHALLVEAAVTLPPDEWGDNTEWNEH
ncbi:MAG TPA: glycoside hydrolase family 15 protein [Acidimicrobiia bacterium]